MRQAVPIPTSVPEYKRTTTSVSFSPILSSLVGSILAVATGDGRVLFYTKQYDDLIGSVYSQRPYDCVSTVMMVNVRWPFQRIGSDSALCPMLPQVKALYCIGQKDKYPIKMTTYDDMTVAGDELEAKTVISASIPSRIFWSNNVLKASDDSYGLFVLLLRNVVHLVVVSHNATEISCVGRLYIRDALITSLTLPPIAMYRESSGSLIWRNFQVMMGISVGTAVVARFDLTKSLRESDGCHGWSAECLGMARYGTPGARILDAAVSVGVYEQQTLIAHPKSLEMCNAETNSDLHSDIFAIKSLPLYNVILVVHNNGTMTVVHGVTCQVISRLSLVCTPSREVLLDTLSGITFQRTPLSSCPDVCDSRWSVVGVETSINGCMLYVALLEAAPHAEVAYRRCHIRMFSIFNILHVHDTDGIEDIDVRLGGDYDDKLIIESVKMISLVTPSISNLTQQLPLERVFDIWTSMNDPVYPRPIYSSRPGDIVVQQMCPSSHIKKLAMTIADICHKLGVVKPGALTRQVLENARIAFGLLTLVVRQFKSLSQVPLNDIVRKQLEVDFGILNDLRENVLDLVLIGSTMFRSTFDDVSSSVVLGMRSAMTNIIQLPEIVGINNDAVPRDWTTIRQLLHDNVISPISFVPMDQDVDADIVCRCPTCYYWMRLPLPSLCPLCSSYVTRIIR